jgi:uncharacterized protein
MSTKPLLLAALLLAACAAVAQPRSNGAVPPMPGQGPGVHDSRSAFKPLEEREGVLSWNLLSSVTTRIENKQPVPQFPTQIEKLHQQKVKVQGWMIPLEPGDRQRHFLLSAVPTSCNFCTPAGPQGLIEVRTTQPVRYTLEAFTVEGQLAVLKSDPYGLFYRLTEGAQVAN